MSRKSEIDHKNGCAKKMVAATVSLLFAGVASAADEWKNDTPMQDNQGKIVGTASHYSDGKVSLDNSGFTTEKNWESNTPGNYWLTYLVGNDASLDAKNASFTLKTKTQETDKTQIQSIGVQLNGGATLNLTGDSASIFVESDTYGTNHSNNTGLNVVNSTVNDSATTTDISVTSLRKNGKAVYGVATSGDNTSVNFTGKSLNITLVTHTDRDTATTNVNNRGEAIGIDAYGKGKITASTNTSVKISVTGYGTSANVEAANSQTGVPTGPSVLNGIVAEGGAIELLGTNEITVIGEGALTRGIRITNGAYTLTGGETAGNGTVTLGESTVINVSSKTGPAYGIDASEYKLSQGQQEDYDIALVSNGKLDISAQSDSGESVGIVVNDKSTFTLNGETLINAQKAISGNGIVNAHNTVSANGSLRDFVGQLNLQGEGADLALKLESDQWAGTMNVSEGGSASVGAFTIVDGGKINLDSGELSANSINVDEQSALSLIDSEITVTGSNESSSFGTVSAIGSYFNLGAGSFTFDSINGSGNTVVLTDLKAAKSVSVANRTDEIAVKVTAASNDQYSSVQAAAQAVSEKVSFSTLSGDEKVDTLTIEASDVNNSLTAKLDESGNLYDIVETRNPTLDALSSITVLTGLQWRHEMNELGIRMGDLRLTPEGIGSWARLYGSEQEYGAAGVTQKNTSLQVGFDTSVGSGWIIGAALSYTDGSAKYAQGESDNKGYGLALYGTWMDQSGLYVDLIGKYSRLDTDYKVGSMSGDFDNNAYSLSAEVGWRFDFMDTFFVEPQVEFTYGTIVGEDYQTSNRVAVSQDDFDTLTGRVGFRAGFMFPENKGNVYLRASVLHEWEGEMTTHANKGVSGNTIVDDIGGTYYEFGVGGNFRLNESTAAYVDLEKNCSGEVKENWRWNVGLRYVF